LAVLLLATFAVQLSKSAPVTKTSAIMYNPKVLVLGPENFYAKVDDGTCVGCDSEGILTVVDFYSGL